MEEARFAIDAASFGVTDIYGACELTARLRPLAPEMPAFTSVGLSKLPGLRRLKARCTG